MDWNDTITVPLAGDPSDSSWIMPMEVAHELLLELYKHCPAFEILYGETNV